MSTSTSDKVYITTHLDQPVDSSVDHVFGNPSAEMVLVEYGSYASLSCQEAHRIITNLCHRFGENLCFVFRNKPLVNNDIAHKAAILVEYAVTTNHYFWDIHRALMKKGDQLDMQSLNQIAIEFNLPSLDELDPISISASTLTIHKHIKSAQKSGALFTPTFFVNNRRYESTWDENSLAEALTGSLGNKLQSATNDFVRWGPSAGILLLTMSIVAIFLVNSSFGTSFQNFWQIPLSLNINNHTFSLSLLSWINDGLLTFFFLAVGLELKREFTIGRLSNRRAASLPIAAAIGGVIVPAIIYISLAPSGPLLNGWSTTISTDTAFAIALLVMLGNRVPVRLRIFLTATAIVDDLISIVVVTLFFSTGINLLPLVISIAIITLLFTCNFKHLHHPLPYLMLGVLLWISLHEAGIHPTLTGVIVALFIPTQAQMSFHSLHVQAQTLFKTAALFSSDKVMSKRPSQNAIQILEKLHERVESPADRMLHSITPWSSYFVLPLFALANAGVFLHVNLTSENYSLMMAIFFGLVVGKPTGIMLGAWLADRSNFADKPSSYSWRQLLGAAILSGMGFTMSLFFAGHAFPNPEDFSIAKIAIFLASITAGLLGSYILYHSHNKLHH